MPICYECKKPRHIRLDCPLYKKEFRKKKKRAMVATWSDSEGSTSTEEKETTKTTNLCLMTLKDEVMSLEPQTEHMFDELNSTFHELLSELKKVGVKIKILKNITDGLLNEKKNISKKNRLL